jgi:hypothetical protein
MTYKFDKILFGNHRINGKNKTCVKTPNSFLFSSLSKNCFENNCPNALGIVSFFKNWLPNTFFNEKTIENGFLFLFSKTIRKNKNRNRFAKRAHTLHMDIRSFGIIVNLGKLLRSW